MLLGGGPGPDAFSVDIEDKVSALLQELEMMLGVEGGILLEMGKLGMHHVLGIGGVVVDAEGAAKDAIGFGGGGPLAVGGWQLAVGADSLRGTPRPLESRGTTLAVGGWR